MNPLRLITIGLCAIVGMSVSTDAGEKPIKLRVIYTNDMLGRVEPCG